MAPPWGNCSSPELKYYDTYSVSSCKMNCENIDVRRLCDCRDVHMPQRGNNDVLCTVDQYVNCAKPEICEYFHSVSLSLVLPRPVFKISALQDLHTEDPSRWSISTTSLYCIKSMFHSSCFWGFYSASLHRHVLNTFGTSKFSSVPRR